MKKELIIGGFITLVLIAVGIFYLQNYKLQQAKFAVYASSINAQPQNTISNNSGATSIASSTVLTALVVASHNTVSDCWLLIRSKVYNATSYLNSHPGGKNQIIPFCGQDATQAFQTQGGGGNHSSGAFADLAQLYIGDVGSQADIVVIQKTNTNQVTSNSNSDDSDDDEEWEDD